MKDIIDVLYFMHKKRQLGAAVRKVNGVKPFFF